MMVLVSENFDFSMVIRRFAVKIFYCLLYGENPEFDYIPLDFPSISLKSNLHKYDKSDNLWVHGVQGIEASFSHGPT